MLVLALKNNLEIKNLFRKVYLKNNILLYYKNRLMNSLKNQKITLEFLEITGNNLIVEGNMGSLFNKDDCEIYAKIGDKFYRSEKVDRSLHGIYSLGMTAKDYLGFKLEIPLTEFNTEISFYVEVDAVRIPISIGEIRKYAKINKNLEGLSYYAKKPYMISFRDNKLVMEKDGLTKRLKREVLILKKLRDKFGIAAFKVFIARVISTTIRWLAPNMRIWLFMDRVDKADDNAEHLFRYIRNNKNKKHRIKTYFIIKENSDDFERIGKLGEVVPFGSYKHKLLYLLSDKVISSHADEWVINPFFGMADYYKDLMQFDFIFLQHGITKGDLSNWLNKYWKNIKMFVTSSEMEYESIINGKYGYNRDVVKLTGFPRYDNLKSQDEKQILIMPTWRKNIVKDMNQHTGIRPYNDKFKETEYFKMWNRLINDERFISCAKKFGYKILFFPHPNIQQQLIDFTRNPYVNFPEYGTSYQELFNKSSLLITDYSSVFFDFAYLKKPVLYFQFDEPNWKRGYFDCETMGFGEVCEKYEDLVNKALEYINNGCKMKDFYVKRVENFYAFTDKNNCKRVFEEIINIDRN